MIINVILAIDKNYGIGKNNSLPWKNKDELQIFKQKTLNSIIIVGRKTAESLPYLKDRTIFCVTRKFRNLTSDKNVTFLFNSIDEAIEESKNHNKSIYIAGGGEIYKYVFQKYKNEIKLHISFINDIYDCDTFIDRNDIKDFVVVSEDKYEDFVHYEMKYCETFEKQYINLIDDIMKNGKLRADRTGTGTISLFGKNLNIDVSKYFPLLTTKRVFFRGVVEELLFFISGKTDTKILENRGVNIWKGNTSREFLDGRNLKHYEVGEYGPSYGYNWRFYGKKYKDDASVGVDQLQNAIDLIKNDPTSRRIIVSAWNPSILNEIPLPACHYIFQFYVDNENLSILVNMRSCDVFLGLPFNIASYSLLLYMVSHITNKKPKDVIFMLGDTHIYQNHLKQCTEQISRFMKELPTLEFSRNVNNIDDFTIDDFLLKNYNPCSNIKADMAI